MIAAGRHGQHRLANGIKRAGADIAEDDTERARRERGLTADRALNGCWLETRRGVLDSCRVVDGG